MFCKLPLAIRLEEEIYQLFVCLQWGGPVQTVMDGWGDTVQTKRHQMCLTKAITILCIINDQITTKDKV